MTKWKCTAKLPYGLAYCAGVCELTTLNKTDEPSCCVIHYINGVKWKRVSEEPEQKQEENTLPDWCKVGKMVWNKSAKEYVKITDISNGLITGKGVCDKIDYMEWHLSYYCEARLRPYNAEEMKALVGKVVSTKRDCGIVTGYRGGDNIVFVALENFRYSAEALLEIGATINGKPCGKLEHLENGEWVE